MNQSDINASLVFAAQNNDLVGVQNALTQGADIHYNDDDALQWAAKNGNPEIVKFLLYVGANPSAENNNALSWAELKQNDYAFIAQLLKSPTKTKQTSFADRVNEAINENNTTYKNSDKFKILNVGLMTADGRNVKPQVISRTPRGMIVVPGLPIGVNKRKEDSKEQYFRAIDLLSAQSGQDYSEYKNKFIQMMERSTSGGKS